MESVEQKANWFTQLKHRLKRTGDSEPEQALLRLAIAFSLVLYFVVPWSSDDQFAEIFNSVPNIIIITATSFALLLFAAIVRNPQPSPTRRIAGIVLDMVSLSIILYWTGGDHVPLFVFYLWVTLGNGFRYGTLYLYISFGVSLIGFSSVLLWSSYWQQNQSIAISLLIILMILPIYAGILLKKLHAAIASAKQANQAKSQFLANMSHELRTPLNGVIGMGDLLRETNLSYEQHELLDTMHSSANALLELIENVLDIAKIESGKVLIESKDLDLHAVVNSVIYMLAPMGEKKELTVSCTFEPETPFSLKGDQQHLRQVLINLVNNAIKFTEKGSVILQVRMVGGTETEPRIRFEIIDTGIGIKESDIDKIFDNFTQADVGTSRSFGGTGLGTTISKELVELMGGQIGVKSQINQGSTFWFEITFSATKNPPNSISENNILLLASEDTASIIRPSLKSWEVNFDWVRSSTRALSQLVKAKDDDTPYETVIVDQASLIDINAVQFAQLVKSEGLLEDTSLVLINSSDTMIDANRANHYYISTLEAPEEKRFLFNALHAAQSVNITDSNIVTMAEHYAKPPGANSLIIQVASYTTVNHQVIYGTLRNAAHKARITKAVHHPLVNHMDELDSIDMLILDMNMPEISGIEVVKSLRFMDTSAKLPVIMLTADATPEARETSLSAGANRFLTKPIDSRILLECIASLSRKIRTNKSEKKTSEGKKPRIKSDFPDSEWYDYTVLHELDILGIEPEFVESLVANFTKDGKQHVSNIKNSMQEDYLEFRESLHALKGSATEIGANKLVEICVAGESIKPYEMGSDKISYTCKRLEEIFNDTITALKNAVTVRRGVLSGKSAGH